MPPKYSLPEIERRWLVHEDRLPSLVAVKVRSIDDKYLHGGRLRLRAVRAEGAEPIFKLGKKYPRVAQLPENVVSVYLSEAEYRLLHELPGSIAQKLRYSVENGSLDIYELPHSRPTLFEVEFSSEAEAAAYTPPHFVAEEVTFNADYTGYALARETF
jgi:CYTH domain-containing protein